MNELVTGKREAFLEAAKGIRRYKLMQAKGYERLAGKARDERTKQLLTGISVDEFKDCEYWTDRIRELAGEREMHTRTLLIDLRVGLMMRILGIRGFFEWAIIA